MDFYASLNVDNFNIEFIGHIPYPFVCEACESPPHLKIPYLINFMKMPHPFITAFSFSWDRDMYIRVTIQMACKAFMGILVTQKEVPGTVSPCDGWGR